MHIWLITVKCGTLSGAEMMMKVWYLVMYKCINSIGSILEREDVIINIKFHESIFYIVYEM